MSQKANMSSTIVKHGYEASVKARGISEKLTSSTTVETFQSVSSDILILVLLRRNMR